jgi:hypothetical protein
MISTKTVFVSSYAPNQTFSTAEEARDFEMTVVPRLEVVRVISKNGSVHQTHIASIDEIVAALGNLWRVPGFDLPDVAQGDL